MGLEVLLDEQTAATVNLRFIDNDVIAWTIPAVGLRQTAGFCTYPGHVQNRQERVALRLSRSDLDIRSCRDRLGILLVLGAAATSGRDPWARP
jgi:hypothetical protein